jgi:hypothetical protein
MKLKSLILASAASLFVAPAAYAADAIVAVDPEPVEYVQICDAYGAGFFFIPGTEVCLDISGRVRVQYGYSNDADAANTFNQDIDYRVSFDARHETEIGTVRAFIRMGENNDVSNRGEFVDTDLAFISVAPNENITVTMGLHDSFYDGESILTAVNYAGGGFTAALAYEERALVGSRLGGNDNAIVAAAGYSANGFSINGELAYELGRELGGVNAPRSFNVGAAYAADRWDVGVNYEMATGLSYATNFDLNNYEAVRFGRDELSIDLGLKLTDKLTASSDWDVLFNAKGWAVENTLAYAVSGNFTVEAELDFVSDMGVDNRTNDRNWHLGLDFIATF